MKHTFITILALLLPLFCAAQSGSPSSRFGYGEMDDNVPGEFRAMGGVLTGMRSNHAINPSQPAAYTAGDSLSFMFDIAVGLGWTHYADSYGKKNVPVGSLEYVTMQFPLWKRWLAFSCGIMPFTRVGYDFTLSNQVGDYAYSVNYSGLGGLSQVYAGLGFNILDWFAAGANFYYMFGSVTNSTLLSFTASDVNSSQVVRYMDMSAFRTKVGAQFFHSFTHHSFVLGATFDPQLPLGGDYLVTETQTLDTAVVDNGCDMPMSWSVGASYTWHNRLTIAADYSYQDWSNARYFGQTNFLHDRQKVAFGFQYQHNPFGMKYHERMIWRLGASVSNSYTKGSNWQNFGLSLGMGFPLRTTATMINLAAEYERKAALSGMIEHNTKLVIDVAINEQWFHKRKL